MASIWRTTWLFLALVSLSLLGGFAARGQAPLCGDADDSGAVTVTDGVQTLRSAAGLFTSCTLGRCDVDGSGSVTVTDGVKVLRVAAGLSVLNLACSTEGRFIDNGDGTVIDTKTGLQWEKKTTAVGSGANFADPHDVDNYYTWSHDRHSGPSEDLPDGTVFTDFLSALNTPPCFAGHCDWRLPTVNRQGDPTEFETIVDLSAPGCGAGSPCIDPIFGPTIAVEEESRPGSSEVYPEYLSATPDGIGEGFTWVLDFIDGEVFSDNDDDYHFARAVRSP